MVRFYYEKETGDYLSIELETNAYYRQQGLDHFQGRAAAILNCPESVCTLGISRTHLRKKCRRIAKASVPIKWLRWL